VFVELHLELRTSWSALATKEDIARLDTRGDDLRMEKIDLFEHVDK
jgi:hypothetical protein